MKAIRCQHVFFLSLLFCLSFQLVVFSAESEDVKGVNILLVDNSGSVPSLDPAMERAQVLESILNMLEGYENRLILFGGRDEIFLDDPSRFINDGLHTDFFYAFQTAVNLCKEYPPDCKIKIILITDGIPDAFTSDYPEQSMAKKAHAMLFSSDQTLKLLEENPVGTFIILLGDQYDLSFMEQISIHANGFVRANPLTHKAAEFLGNNGILLKQFIFEVEPDSGVEEIKEIVHKIVHEDTPYFEYGLLGILALAGVVLLALFFRSFPATGDREIIELVEGIPILIGAEVTNPSVIVNPGHFSRRRGFQHVSSTKYALAGISYQQRQFDFSSNGLQGLDKLDPISKSFLDEDVRRLSTRLDEVEQRGRDEEIITATDLKYYCSNLDVDEVRKILNAREMERMNVDAKDFLYAKVYVSMAPDLLEEMTDHKVLMNIPKQNIIRATVVPGQKYQFGKYKVRIVSLDKESKFSAKVVLEYISVPSLLGLKRMAPASIQKLLRFRGRITSQFTAEI